jgi:hypothetical protein
MKGQKMMKRKLVRLKDSDPLAMKLKKGAVIKMSDGWCGKVDQDDGATVTLIRDGAEPLNDQFIGYRGFTRYRTTIGGSKAMCRSVIVDLARKSMVKCGVVVVDRARLESEWESAPGN